MLDVQKLNLTVTVFQQIFFSCLWLGRKKIAFYKSNWFNLSSSRPAENCFEGRSYIEQQLQTELDLLWDSTRATVGSYSLSLAHLCVLALCFVGGAILGGVAQPCIIKTAVRRFSMLIPYLLRDRGIMTCGINILPDHQKPNSEKRAEGRRHGSLELLKGSWGPARSSALWRQVQWQRERHGGASGEGQVGVRKRCCTEEQWAQLKLPEFKELSDTGFGF